MTAPQHVSLLYLSRACATALILLDGWSKTYAMTGWRLGYGVWPEALFPHAERLAINCHSCVNAAAQFAGIAALTGRRNGQPHGRGLRRAPPRSSSRRLNKLPGFRCATPGGAFYAFPNIAGTGFDAKHARNPAAGGGRRGHHRRHQFRRLWRRLSALLLCGEQRSDRGSHDPNRHLAESSGNYAPRPSNILGLHPRHRCSFSVQNRPVSLAFQALALYRALASQAGMARALPSRKKAARRSSADPR